jgi:hypothetical protein
MQKMIKKMVMMMTVLVLVMMTMKMNHLVVSVNVV